MMQCADHDYIEVACLYGYRIQLQLKDQQIVSGYALTTTYQAANDGSDDKVEVLKIQTEQQIVAIALSEISVLTAITKNRFFDVVTF